MGVNVLRSLSISNNDGQINNDIIKEFYNKVTLNCSNYEQNYWYASPSYYIDIANT
jgi:hypothetical protein